MIFFCINQWVISQKYWWSDRLISCRNLWSFLVVRDGDSPFIYVMRHKFWHFIILVTIVVVIWLFIKWYSNYLHGFCCSLLIWCLFQYLIYQKEIKFHYETLASLLIFFLDIQMTYLNFEPCLDTVWLIWKFSFQKMSFFSKDAINVW